MPRSLLLFAPRRSRIGRPEAADALLAVRDDDIRAIRSDLKDLREALGETRSDMRLLKWQVGFSIALSLAVIGLLLRLMLKLGAL